MLGENLGEPLEEFERPSSVIQDPLGKVAQKHLDFIYLYLLRFLPGKGAAGAPASPFPTGCKGPFFLTNDLVDLSLAH